MKRVAGWTALLVAACCAAALAGKLIARGASGYMDARHHVDYRVGLLLPVRVVWQTSHGWAFLALILGLLVFIAWAGRRLAGALHDLDKHRTVAFLTAFFIISAALMLVGVTFSGDPYAYIIFGRLLALHGINPYFLPVSLDVGGDQILRRCLLFYGNPPPADNYGPLWTLFNAAIAKLDAARPLGFQIGVLRAIAVLASGAAALGLLKIVSSKSPAEGIRKAGLFAFHPLVLYESAVGAHNDTIMVALAVWAFAIVEDYPLLAGLILGASIAIKYVSVVALPFLVIRAARNGRLAGFLSAALAIGVPVICFKPFWLGPQTLYSVVGHGGTFAMSPAWMVNLPFFASGRAALPALGSSLVLPLLGQPSWPRLVQLSFVAAFCAVALFAILRFRRSRRLEELWRATSALLWASPIIHPWYLLWLLPAAAGRGRWAVYAWWFGLLIVLRYALDATHLAGQAPWGTAALVALTIAYLTLPVAVARSRRGMHPLDEVVERELPADTVWETQQRPA